MSRCSSCGAHIRWSRTIAGRTIPLDLEPVEDGNLVESPAGVRVYVDNADAGKGLTRYVSHFATCPNADEHRKPRT